MNRLPQLKQNILAGLAKAAVFRLECQRPRKLARELRKELKMCDIKIEDERSEKMLIVSGRRKTGVLVISWKTP